MQEIMFLGADLDAREVNLAPADYVYLKGNFTGSLDAVKWQAICDLPSQAFIWKPLRVVLLFPSTLKMWIISWVLYDSAALARNAWDVNSDVSAQGVSE